MTVEEAHAAYTAYRQAHLKRVALVAETFASMAHKLSVDAIRQDAEHDATKHRLISILRDETNSAAVYADCVKLVGERT